MRSIIPTVRVAALASVARATSRTATKAALLLFSFSAFAQATQDNSGIQVGQSYHNDVSPALRELGGPGRPPETNISDPLVEHGSWLKFLGLDMPGPILNFDGITCVGCSGRPATDGEVGATQYVQVVVGSYAIFDKATGAQILGPNTIESLFAGFGGVCQSSSRGDGMVLYDQLAGRWVMSQFAGTGVATDVCLAISTTSDATGTWNRYAFHLGSSFFVRRWMSVWPDGYYMSSNVFNSSGTTFLGPQPFVFDRTKILSGLPASVISPGITGGPTEETYLPVDFDGSTLPPDGAPNPFVEFPSAGTYRIFHFHADFTTPANSTFTLFASPPAAAFTPLCPGTRDCIPQLGSGTGVDGVAGRLMFRLAYRNFGTPSTPNESMVGNYSVSSNGVSGVRWFELKNVTSGPVTVAQESTYQPDTTWRWLGSAAMDHAGNFAIGFSASDATIYPQIRYAGRLATDPPNTLAQGEAHLFDGIGSSDTSSWAEYSVLTVDPVDDCTFWYTNIYYVVPSSSDRRTRIGNFKFAECSGSATPTPTPTATATLTPTPSIDLGVTLTDFPDPVQVGHDLHYTITVINHYPDTALGVVMTDTLPAGVLWTFTAPSQGTCTGSSTITCNLGTIPSSGTATVIVIVRPTGAGTLSNTATVSGPNDPNPANNSSTQVTTVFAATPTPSPTATPTATATPTVIVTTVNDNGPGSLRQTLADASNGDTIGFAPALNGQIITLTSGELTVDKNLIITGPGPDQLAVSGSLVSRIFHILSGHTVVIEGLTITNGRAPAQSGGGGGILNEGTLSLGNSTVRSNSTNTGGISNSGGGIANSGTITITSSVISGNTAELSGGAIFSNGTMTITNSMISGNSALYVAGGIASSGALTIVSSTVSSNYGGHGGMLGQGAAGGIYVGGGSLDLIQSTLSNNTAVYQGGGIQSDGGTITITDSTITNNSSAVGGGIETLGTATLDIHNSTISGNIAGFGAGISNGGGPFAIRNSSVSGNSASLQGGGIGTGGGGATITNCTMSGNTAPQGGVNLYVSGPLEIGNTILNAGSSSANIFQTGTNMITSLGYNLSSDDAGGFLNGPGDQLNTDPLLGPLQNNGGPTYTHDLLNGSPALNTGDPNFTPPPSTDQRGFPRVHNGRIDIGSVEEQSGTPPTPTPSPTATPARPLNLSTRMLVQTGDEVGIGGFIITGSAPKEVLLRAIGPSLTQFGIPDALADPVLEFGGLTNDNWRDDPAQEALIIATGIPPTNDLESAIVATLSPGPYTAIVRGKNNTSGVGLVEVYDLNPEVDSKLANLSTRAFVSTGNNIVIAGFILGGNSGNDRIVVRGLGPDLVNFGVPNPLADPTLELRDSNGALLAYNNDWQDICSLGPPCIPFGLAPSDQLDAVIDITLPPGAYTALLAGLNNGTGVGIVEVYDIGGTP